MEKVINHRIWNKLIPEKSIQFPNVQQQGFQKGIGCQTASFNLQETIHDNLEQHSRIFTAFLDIKKAFDTVWHDALIRKLELLGVTGKILRLINNSYCDISSAVVANNVTSDWVPVLRGLRQGGCLSSLLYLAFFNDLLDTLSHNKNGAYVNNQLPSGNPALADDLTLVSTSPEGLQSLLSTCHNYSRQWKFEFNATKSKVVIFGGQFDKVSFSWHLGDRQPPVTDSYTHVGVILLV